MTKIRIDFTAQLTFFTSEQSGRTTPVFRGYRPHIHFDDYPDIATSGMQDWDDRDSVSPGESVLTHITILAIEYFAGKLYEGMTFTFNEGARVVGTGIIVEVINPDLQQ